MSHDPSNNECLDINLSEEEMDWPLHPPYYNYSREERANIKSIRCLIDLPWELACRRRNFEMIRHLVQCDSRSINYQSSDGTTLLMLASADSSDARGARLLHENGARIDMCDRSGKMALHFAAESGNVELLQYILQHTEIRCIQQWFNNIPNVLRTSLQLHSFVCCTINSGNVRCLEIILTSNKFSESILQAPFVQFDTVHSPLSYVFYLLRDDEEKLNSYLQLLVEHTRKITTLDNFFRVLQVEWPREEMISFRCPFSEIFLHDSWPFSKKKFYFEWLNENNITIDYCLSTYHDNRQPFANFIDYSRYYGAVETGVGFNNIEALKLIISNSAILEPDKLIIYLNSKLDKDAYKAYFHDSNYYRSDIDSWRNIFKYLLSLKPFYYKQQVQLRSIDVPDELCWYPYTSTSEEFAESTLQQLCRTTIRNYLREYTLHENLRDFRQNILDLKLPSPIKDFLLFKS